MNLQALAASVVQVVNPTTPFVWQRSTGYTTNSDGSRTPSYAASVTITGQAQPLSSKDLRQLESLSLQGTLQAIYFSQPTLDLVRSLKKGGDLLTDPGGNVWLVTQVLEFWQGAWVKVVTTLQNGS